jgi:hypothetical protein
MAQVYTYYDANAEPEIRPGPLEGRGKAWVRGRYEPPTYPSALNVRVGEAGIKVWMVIQWLGFYDSDVDRMLGEYGNVLTREDAAAAVWFYRNNKVDTAEIDRKIAEEAA